MRQQTIDQYFIHPKSRNAPAKVSFLSLPFSIRRRIYAELNLPLPQTINLNFSHSDADECEYPCLDPPEISSQDDTTQTHSVSHFLGTGPDPSFQRSLRCNCNVQPDFYVDWDCRCDNAPYQLLYLTKMIAEEVRYVFWSEHTFTVSLTDLGGLDVLYALPGHAVRQMTKLLIRLNVYECQKGFICRGRECYLDCHPGCRTRGHSRLLSKARSGYFSYVLRKWKEMCEFLKASLLPRRLKLAFICDMEDLETAKAIVAPMSQLPALKECSIRLGISPIGNSDTPSKLQQLAAKTAMQLTRQFTDKPFPFLHLPRELQLKILGYTDLVTSCDLQCVGAGPLPGINPVTWFERFGIRFNARYFYYRRDGSGEGMRYNGIKCCHGCSDDYKTCLCRAKHAAFSTSCTCWRMPTAIFQVSHHIREAAESIFYSRNHFVCTLFTDGPSPILGALSFLNRVPPRMIKYIRHVTIIDPRTPVFVETSNIHSRIFGPQWSEVLNIFAREGALPKLNLTFAVLHESRTPDWWIYEDHGNWRIKHDTPQKVIDGVMGYCIKLGKELGKLIHEHGTLRNFFVHLSRPLQDPGQNMYRLQCEREVEKIAMGEGYDSVARGKFLRMHAWNGYECAESCVACPDREPDDNDFWLE